MASIIGIDPTVDFAFKLMLGSPEHSAITIHFLNAILSDGPKITCVELQNPILRKNFDGDKLSVLDILATDEHGRCLNIEMQTSLPAGLRQRLAYYDARLYIDQLEEGEQYHELRPAIVICVLTVPLFPSSAAMHTEFRLRDKNGLVLTDDLQVHTLELTKLTVTRQNLIRASPAECWAYFLRFARSMSVKDIRELFPEPEFAEAAGVLEMINQTPGQLHEYSARLKLRLDDEARMLHALQEGRKEGHRQGREEGHAEGHAEGLQEGRQEGRQEGKLFGRIALLQELLSTSSPTEDELANYDQAELFAVLEQLEQQLAKRKRL